MISQSEQNNSIRKGYLDNVTKIFSENVPTPLEAAQAARDSLSPLTRYEVMRGIRRPSYNEALAAAQAAQDKHKVELSSVIERGLQGTAQDNQTIINALNTQAVLGNQDAGRIRNVLSGATAGMAPESQVLFTNEFLGRLNEVQGKLDDQGVWNLASTTLKDIGAKPKAVLPPSVTYYDEDGNRVSMLRNDKTGQYDILGVAPPKTSGQAPVNRLIPLIDKTTDDQGNVHETTSWQAVAPGRGGEQPRVLGSVGTPGQSPLQGDKVTPPKTDIKESANISTIKDAEEIAKNARSKILDENGNVNNKVVLGMAGNIPYTEGRQVGQELKQAILNYIFIKSGQTVTEQERNAWLSIFMPSPFDSDKAVRSKLDRLDDFFSGATKFLPKYLQDKVNGSSGSTQLNERQQLILKKAQSLKETKDTDALKKLLKDNGIDPGML